MDYGIHSTIVVDILNGFKMPQIIVHHNLCMVKNLKVILPSIRFEFFDNDKNIVKTFSTHIMTIILLCFIIVL